MEPTSLSLLDRLQRERQHDDWTRFVDLYQPFIYKFIKLDTTLSSDAEDVCQEVMRKIVSHLPNFNRVRDGSFRCWLKTITVNEVRYYWRRRLRGRKSGEVGDLVPLESLADPNEELSQQWDREHGRYLLGRLQKLVEPDFSATTWRAFHLRVLEERSSEEVASMLQITRNAVDIAKSRVLARLRKEAAGFLE